VVKEQWWRLVNSSMIYLIYFKNFYKCHNVPPPRTSKKRKKTYYLITEKPSIKLFLINVPHVQQLRGEMDRTTI
jgi:hypothetical protein